MREQETNSQENREIVRRLIQRNIAHTTKPQISKQCHFVAIINRTMKKNFNSEVDSIAYENLVCAKGSISNL